MWTNLASGHSARIARDLRRIAGVLEEQRAARAKRRHLADVVAKRPLPADDLLVRLEEQAPAVRLLEPAREVHRMVVGERVHVGEGDLVLDRRVRAAPVLCRSAGLRADTARRRDGARERARAPPRACPREPAGRSRTGPTPRAGCADGWYRFACGQ